jgi:hypothetical protein
VLFCLRLEATKEPSKQFAELPHLFSLKRLLEYLPGIGRKEPAPNSKPLSLSSNGCSAHSCSWPIPGDIVFASSCLPR